ncbi:hypothetical protein HmCmsJML079_02018 [Escherichia coli]|nr:hypothetical protein BvCmsJ76A_02441 [Escherichia coli]GCY55187.1 hypothetical protein HmCmsJML079_02018 [Escherichia coli]GDH15777.1 hypothetical protein BvCmsKKP036_04996 [Escherichia coli]GDH91544.1 hypothetical protein BvCmsKKP062_03095 [Escherichia coli]GDJ96042.1 hypothetical protein BvCmsKSP026_00276 [Escherichia coli]
MPIIVPIPRAERHLMQKTIHKTNDKNHARRLTAMLMLHRGDTVRFSLRHEQLEVTETQFIEFADAIAAFWNDILTHCMRSAIREEPEWINGEYKNMRRKLKCFRTKILDNSKCILHVDICLPCFLATLVARTIANFCTSLTADLLLS